MTPEEKQVISAAKRWARGVRIGGDRGAVVQAARASDLLLAVQALKVSGQPEHTVSALPCRFPSPSGRMACEETAGHDPHDTLSWIRLGPNRSVAVRLHHARAADGSARTWNERLEMLTL